MIVKEIEVQTNDFTYFTKYINLDKHPNKYTHGRSFGPYKPTA